MLPNPTEHLAFNRPQQASFQVNKMNAAVLLLLSILAVASATKFDRRPVKSEGDVDEVKADAFTAVNKLSSGNKKRDVGVPSFVACSYGGNAHVIQSCPFEKIAAKCKFPDVVCPFDGFVCNISKRRYRTLLQWLCVIASYDHVVAPKMNKMNAAVLLLLSILAVASATKFDRRPVRSEEEVNKSKSDLFAAIIKGLRGIMKGDVLVKQFRVCNDKSTSVVVSCRRQLAIRCQPADVYCRKSGNGWKCLRSDLYYKQPICCDYYCP
eukprot:gene11861-13094_t